MSKEKFDLSNVGGQPKDWAQRQQENETKSNLGAKEWGLVWWIVALGLGLVVCVVLLGLRLLS